MSGMAQPFGASRRTRTKAEVCEELLGRLRERGDLVVDDGLAAAIRAHFATLPTRYALDVNIDSLDVLSHKRLLEEARSDPSTVSFAVRPVEIAMARQEAAEAASPSTSASASRPGAPLPARPGMRRVASRCKPAFGSSPNLQALALEANEKEEAPPGARRRSTRERAPACAPPRTPHVFPPLPHAASRAPQPQRAPHSIGFRATRAARSLPLARAGVGCVLSLSRSLARRSLSRRRRLAGGAVRRFRDLL